MYFSTKHGFTLHTNSFSDFFSSNHGLTRTTPVFASSHIDTFECEIPLSQVRRTFIFIFQLNLFPKDHISCEVSAFSVKVVLFVMTAWSVSVNRA